MRALIIINVVSVTILVFLFYRSYSKKEAYVVNQKLFESFEGKNELDIRLVEMQKKQQIKLDSLANLIDNTNDNQVLIEEYNQMVQLFNHSELEVSKVFAEDIWKQINGYLAEFGDEHGYEFIYGATGDGNLMYASDALNITDDLIKYINSKYEDDE